MKMLAKYLVVVSALALTAMASVTPLSERSYTHKDGYSFEYTSDETTITITAKVQGEHWIGFGIGKDMVGDSVMCFKENGEFKINRYHVTVFAEIPTTLGGPLVNTSCAFNDGFTEMTFTRNFAAAGGDERAISSSQETGIMLSWSEGGWERTSQPHEVIQSKYGFKPDVTAAAAVVVETQAPTVSMSPTQEPTPYVPEITSTEVVGNKLTLNDFASVEYDRGETEISFTVTVKHSSWIGLGFSEDGRMALKGSDIFICTELEVGRYWVTEKAAPANPSPVLGASCTFADGATVLKFTRTYAKEKEQQREVFKDKDTTLIFAHGEAGVTKMEFHVANRGAVVYNFLTGASTKVGVLEMEWSDILRVIVFSLSTILFAWTAFNFHRTYKNAYLKSALFLWYAVYVGCTVLSILVVHNYPETQETATALFNLGGWFIAATGTADSCALYFAITNVSAEVERVNKKAALITLCGLYPLVAVVFTLMFVLDVGMAALRGTSCVIIVVESLSFTLVLFTIRKTNAFTGQLKYFGFTMICRFGILIGIVLAILEYSRLIVNLIHFFSTFFVVVSIWIVGKGVSMAREKKGLSTGGSIFSRVKSKLGGGSRAGSKAGSTAGSKAGSKAGSRAGSKAGSRAGSKAGSRAGSKAGSKAGSRAGSRAGGSKVAPRSAGSGGSGDKGSGSKGGFSKNSKQSSKQASGSKGSFKNQGSKQGSMQGSNQGSKQGGSKAISARDADVAEKLKEKKRLREEKVAAARAAKQAAEAQA